jgi:uncharacterized protein HemY
LLPDGATDKARILHQLGTIDVHEGEYASAREKFAKALQARQSIGDRAGEAATFFQMGVVLRDRATRNSTVGPQQMEERHDRSTLSNRPDDFDADRDAVDCLGKVGIEGGG